MSDLPLIQIIRARYLFINTVSVGVKWAPDTTVYTPLEFPPLHVYDIESRTFIKPISDTDVNWAANTSMLALLMMSTLYQSQTFVKLRSGEQLTRIFRRHRWFLPVHHHRGPDLRIGNSSSIHVISYVPNTIIYASMHNYIHFVDVMKNKMFAS